MKKLLTVAFKTQLCDAVQAIESQSQVELVVLIRSRSDNYHDLKLIWAALGALGLHSYAMFAPEFFADSSIYLAPIVGFALGLLFAHLPAVLRLSIAPERRQKQVEIMARALFQKGGLAHTQAKIGILIYFSWLERSVYILPDRGAEQALPPELWQEIQAQLNRIYQHKAPEQAILTQLATLAPLFALYLPKSADDINELPDAMEIAL